jgi:hypothetical protein
MHDKKATPGALGTTPYHNLPSFHGPLVTDYASDQVQQGPTMGNGGQVHQAG